MGIEETYCMQLLKVPRETSLISLSMLHMPRDFHTGLVVLD
jgi:hypothetical protein